LAERDAVERPAVGARHVAQLLFRLRERGVDAGLAVAGPFEEELQGERGLARAGIPLDEIHPVRGKPPAEDVVEAFSTRRGSGKALKISIGHRLRLERPKRTPLPDTPLCRHLWRRGGDSARCAIPVPGEKDSRDTKDSKDNASFLSLLSLVSLLSLSSGPREK